MRLDGIRSRAHRPFVNSIPLAPRAQTQLLPLHLLVLSLLFPFESAEKANLASKTHRTRIHGTGDCHSIPPKGPRNSVRISHEKTLQQTVPRPHKAKRAGQDGKHGTSRAAIPGRAVWRDAAFAMADGSTKGWRFPAEISSASQRRAMGGRELPVIKVFGYLFRMRLSARGLARRRLFILLGMAAALWSEVRVVSSGETTRPSRWEGGPRGAEFAEYAMRSHYKYGGACARDMSV
ncbi:hypothetical protein CPLU01_05972 [Colletotrichum plurivorum]|uniref:Uncharacterized protein n=1 Tax=Colletotrichum plurivorum TaxID=2175906 RepID=A0A8H6KK52_9PEZI|nr:hypothetical protein CPLU01_05972 [Colletotrichum plurivorum]